MFEVISNPFEEMTQGVVSSGLGYIAEKSSRSFAWLWWLLLPLLLILALAMYVGRQEKKKQEAKKLEEDTQKKLQEAKAKQNLLYV